MADELDVGRKWRELQSTLNVSALSNSRRHTVFLLFDEMRKEIDRLRKHIEHSNSCAVSLKEISEAVEMLDTVVTHSPLLDSRNIDFHIERIRKLAKGPEAW